MTNFSEQHQRELERRRALARSRPRVVLTDAIVRQWEKRAKVGDVVADDIVPGLVAMMYQSGPVWYWLSPDDKLHMLGWGRRLVSVETARHRAAGARSRWRKEWRHAQRARLENTRRVTSWLFLPEVAEEDLVRLDAELTRFMEAYGHLFKNRRSAQEALFRKLLLRGLTEVEKQHAQRQDD